MTDADNREYPERPIPGVGGVIFEGQSVLLAKRAREPSLGLWSLPGGAVELGETLEEALKREIHEETSINIEIGGLVRLLDRIVYDREGRVRFHYVIADYWGWHVSGRLRADSDISDARFMEIDRIREAGLDREVEETIFMGLRMREKSRVKEII
jgi:8-oxo-dGTP diphosphatase